MLQAGSTPAGRQPQLVAGCVGDAPEVDVQRVHAVCGRTVEEVSFCLDGFFDEVCSAQAVSSWCKLSHLPATSCV